MGDWAREMNRQVHNQHKLLNQPNQHTTKHKSDSKEVRGPEDQRKPEFSPVKRCSVPETSPEPGSVDTVPVSEVQYSLDHALEIKDLNVTSGSWEVIAPPPKSDRLPPGGDQL